MPATLAELIGFGAMSCRSDTAHALPAIEIAFGTSCLACLHQTEIKETAFSHKVNKLRINFMNVRVCSVQVGDNVNADCYFVLTYYYFRVINSQRASVHGSVRLLDITQFVSAKCELLAPNF